MLDLVASYHCTQCQGKLMIQTQEIGEKLHFGPDLGLLVPKSGREFFFSKIWLGVIHKGYPHKFGNFWDLPPPVQTCPHLVDHPPPPVRICPLLPDPSPPKCADILHGWPPSSVTRYHGQLSSCTISKKTNDPILRKLSDGRTDGRIDGRE